MSMTESGIEIPEYPKIKTLFARDPENMKHIIPWQFSADEFEVVDRWLVTEKIDGTNVRVIWADGELRFGGRTGSAQMPVTLLDTLREIFDVSKLSEVFPGAAAEGCPVEWPTVVLYGEGYGAKIQKGGGNYRSDQSFRLFDVAVWGDDGRGSTQWWWLRYRDMLDVAFKLGIEAAPLISPGLISTEEAVLLLAEKSRVARNEGQVDWHQEGVVARVEPALFSRRGDRLIWKLKARDLPIDVNNFTVGDVFNAIGPRPFFDSGARPLMEIT